jgi:hypothetical protein
MNRKNGNTRSVGVQPCHSACLRGGYTYFQLPGVLTIIINAIVIPLKISSETSLLLPFAIGELIIYGKNNISVIILSAGRSIWFLKNILNNVRLFADHQIILI